MKGLFSHLKSTKKTPVELVKRIRQLLIRVDKNANLCECKISELRKSILEMRTFREDTFRLLIVCLPRLEIGFRRDAGHVITNLQRQKVECKLIASGYLEKKLDLLDILISAYEHKEGEDGIAIALTYGAIARECIRHQSVAKYVLESQHLKKFFRYFQNPHFDVASDAQETFKQLLTRHKSIAVKLLGELLCCGSNSGVRVKYLSSLSNLKVRAAESS
ncbi:hypothetical protein Patl1_02489 [Pistacia atlantica]|uniref:Uncharacterized protein n=1 Tax=Pistacia atlantica TaxID=434234 RepID=A0ACC1CC76_9ROSI|nr:hypothetical protein Patl1_02489 [Pistacia atlantica]